MGRRRNVTPFANTGTAGNAFSISLDRKIVLLILSDILSYIISFLLKFCKVQVHSTTGAHAENLLPVTARLGKPHSRTQTHRDIHCNEINQAFIEAAAIKNNKSAPTTYYRNASQLKWHTTGNGDRIDQILIGIISF